MKRDIRINFSILDSICQKTYTYMNALENMKKSLKKLYDSLESENSGKSIDALKGLYRVLEKQIDQCHKEVEDIHSIFRGYIEEMQGIIAPKNYSEMMQVDRNDIWWNMEAIAGASEAIGLLKYERETYESFPSLDDSEEEIENQRRNGREIEEICGIIDRYRNRIIDCMDDMNGLYRNRVVPYEDKDDEYARKAKKFYDKYTNTWERICDRTSSINRSINDVFEGLISSIGDMVTGLVGLGIGIVTYIPAGIGLAVTKVTGDAPDFLEDCMEKTEGYNEMIGSVWKDPALMVEGLGQNISDSWEEKGVAYCTGYATGEVLQAVVLKKISASKINKVDDASVISKSELILKGKNINVAETLTRLGVSNKEVTSIISKLNIDDLKKLYIYLEKNPDVHKTNRVIDKMLKGDSVDDVIKGVSRAEKAISKIPEIEVRFNYKSNYDEAEFARQLADQEAGMNKLTVDEYLKNRERYIAEGRGIEGNMAQQAARKEAQAQKIAELRKSGLSYSEAKKKAEEWIKTQAVLHNPDQVAGGHPSNIGGMGDKKINSSIGSQWKYRIDVVDEQIKALANEMTEEERKLKYLNIKLKY